MCGFAGFLAGDFKGDKAAVVTKMGERIIHRGPDQDAIYTDDDIALCFRRLALIDLEGGAQPMFNEDGSLVLVFNGEIYNFRQLREDLIGRGHIFKNKSDSEVLLHGYEEYGPEFTKKLRGMYAFVIWDKKNKRLFGARDIFGIKPFYYYKKNNEFMFGSEIKAFLDHPLFEKEVNEERLPDWLSYEYLPDEETFFKNVYKLPAAHYFIYENGKMTTTRYYKIKYEPDETKTLEEWESLISKTFEESVDAHKFSDVEVGCFLSSGVDSSYTVKEVTKFMKNPKTFSVGYTEEKYSELPYAQDFAKAIGVENISNLVSAEEYFEYAGIIQYYMDEPLPNPSEVPLFFLSKNAAKYVKAVLSGEGADELFGGYPMYIQGGHFAQYSKIPKGVRKGVSAIAGKLPYFKGKNFITRGALEPYQRFMRANYVFHYNERDKYLKKKYESKDPSELSKKYFDDVKEFDEPTQLQYVDINTWMLYDILQKADKMTMANSLELRVPFLDKKVLELSVKIPTKYRVDGETTKVALRGAALKEIPERTANKKKLGFPVPLNDWMREDRFYNMIKEKFEGDIAERFFNVPEIMKLLNDHKEGKAHNMKKVWTIYTFILWYEQFFVLN
ncbi:MAG: asparagine synthase (glutamine-hydrolyzing) [Lachnospiraceae bacterium]|nr:asparagine synthase (glutamine-hydrolyzing) [Lachnospiraceae bacterium]